MERIQNLIAQAKLEQAIKECLAIARSSNDSDLITIFTSLSGRYATNEREHLMGTRDLKDYNLERNQITNALLNSIKELQAATPTDSNNSSNNTTTISNSTTTQGTGNIVIQGANGGNISINVGGGNTQSKSSETDELREEYANRTGSKKDFDAKGEMKKVDAKISDLEQDDNLPTLVFLTADPLNKNPIRALDQKQTIVDAIGKKINFKDNTRTKYNELDSAVKGCEIVHITVHGVDNTLVFEHDENKNQEAPVDIEFLDFQLRQNDDVKKLILLIACNSSQMAKAMVDNGLAEAAIGTNIEISAGAAVDFCKQFYKIYVTGDDIKKGFNNTCFLLNKNPLRQMNDDGTKYDYTKAFVLYTKS